MITFDKLQLQDIQELQSIISKNVEKSELERSYLYTHDTIEKARIYIWCFRFLYSIRNLTKEGNLKNVIDVELKLQDDTYVKVCELLHRTERGHFNKHRNLDRLRNELLMNDDVDDLIDSFAVLLEKSSVLSMSRLKGFVLEGQSGKEFKKIFEARGEEMNKFEEDVHQPELEEPETKEESEEEVKEEVEEKVQKDNIDVTEFIGEGVMKEELNETEQEDEENEEIEAEQEDEEIEEE